MKTLKFAMAAIATSLALASCSLDSEQSNHQTTFLPVNAAGRVLYADQSIDSLAVFSTDSWKLEAKTDTVAPFFTVSPTSQTIPANYVSTDLVIITAQPNTSGAVRRGYLALTTTFTDFGTMTLPVAQLSWLNILSPAPTFAYLTDGTRSETPTFQRELPYTATTAQLSFYLYDTNKEQQTVTSDADWLVIPATENGYGAGRHDLSINVPANPAASARKATVTITSAGVSTQVVFIQAAKS